MKQLTATLIALLLSWGALAQTSINTVGSDDKTAISGFDAVGFMLQKKALPGDPAFSHEHAGAKWLFASAEHRDAFAAEPEKFVPAWGGQCAWAISERTLSTKKLSGAFEVLDGKTYLFTYGNRSKAGPRDDFLYGRTSRALRLREGEKYWAEVKGKLEDGSIAQPNASNYTRSPFE